MPPLRSRTSSIREPNGLMGHNSSKIRAIRADIHTIRRFYTSLLSEISACGLDDDDTWMHSLN
jgi:hypothetical protein